MRFVFKNQLGQWIKATGQYERIIAHAATAAVRLTGKDAREASRANIASAGFGSKWQRSMVFAMHPRSGDVLNPWGWLHSKINFADVFETGKTIVGRPLLWIPLASVPPWPGDPTRQMSAKKYVESVGPLKSARRPGKPPLLLGLVRARLKPQPWGTFVKPRKSKKPSKAPQVWIPMFVGVSTARIEKRFDIEGVVHSAAQNLPQHYVDNLERYEGR